jgi:hypothetical protein
MKVIVSFAKNLNVAYQVQRWERRGSSQASSSSRSSNSTDRRYHNMDDSSARNHTLSSNCDTCCNSNQ